MMGKAMLVIFAVLCIIMLGICVIFISLLSKWLKAIASGTPIHILRLLGIKLRGNPIDLLIDAHVVLSKENVTDNLDETEYTYIQNKNRIHSAEDLVRLVKEKKAKD